MEKVRMMETLKGRLQNVSDEYVEQKTRFMFSITGHFLDFCKCDNSRDLLDRIWSGDFAEKDGEMSPMSNDTPSWNNTGAPGNMWGSNDTMPQQPNATDSWPATTEAPVSTTASEEDDFMEKVKRFASLDRKELVSQVLQDLVQIMCESASQYFLSINTLEDAIIQYRNSHP
uniref:Uncharacterized protein n=1 Tax=Biomphalaria glabrata TaxID=6526 RepID=A0A2C9M0T2_BIOGL